MSAQLPYLPPLKSKSAVRQVAEGVVEDVKAAPNVATKGALLLRGAPALGIAASRDAADTLQEASRIYLNAQSGAVEGAREFASTLFGGPQAGPAPTLAAPAPVTSGNSTTAAPVAAAPAAAPATQAPVQITTENGLTRGRVGNNVAIVGDPNKPAPAPVQNLPVLVRASPVATGISQQAEYAAMQRAAVLDAAAAAAAAGNAGNATARYNAALNALPNLSGQNNFATTQAQLAADRDRTAALDLANQRTVEAQRYDTDTKAKEVRRNAQPTVIGEEINPDPLTRPFAPVIKKYGFVERDESGKIIVKDMQGNIQKPPAAPVSRSEFITRNKAANPGMSEADLGREYDKKYGGKS